MHVCLNGKETEVAEQLTVGGLVGELGLNPDTVVVEHNMAILPKEQWPECMLAAGDKLEIITFVGGG